MYSIQTHKEHLMTHGALPQLEKTTRGVVRRRSSGFTLYINTSTVNGRKVSSDPEHLLNERKQDITQKVHLPAIEEKHKVSEHTDTSKRRVGNRRRRAKSLLPPLVSRNSLADDVQPKERRFSVESSVIAREILKRRRSFRDVGKEVNTLGVITRSYFLRQPPGSYQMSLIDRFRRAANIVFVCVLLAKRGNKRTKREMKDPFGNIENTNDTFGGLAFNPSYFKANRQQRLSEEAKRILTSDRSQRTDYQLKYAQIGLRNIESFAEYPVRMQQKLCKVGWLETFEPGRCIVRQGHIAHAFYIILSGTVMVTVTDGENSRVVCFLKRGEAFGELAILNNSKRASTVISRDCVELLAISTEDFEDIFMCQGGVKNVNDPDHHEFLSSLHFLKDWPLHLLETHPTECVFNFFRRGDVLVKDSNYSDWIYIVKSGSAYVLKKLKKVKPCLRKRIYSDDDGVLSLLAGSPRNLTRINKLLSHHDDVIAGENETPRDSDDDIHKHTETSSNESGTRARNGYHNNPDSLKRKRRLIMPTSKGVYLSTTTQHTKTKSIHDKKVKKKKDKGKRKDDDEDEEEAAPLPSNFVQQKRTLASDLDNAKRPDAITDADKNPVFVVLQTLTKGGIFGLAPLVFFDQPSISLVSNGAECIMIRKKFYIEHCTEEMRRRLRREVRPFPQDDELQNSLQDYMNWGEFKTQTLSSTIKTVGASKPDKLITERSKKV